MNIVRTLAILRFKIKIKFDKNPKKLKIKSNFKQYGRTQRLKFLNFHRIATFVRKKMYKNTEKIKKNQ